MKFVFISIATIFLGIQGASAADHSTGGHESKAALRSDPISYLQFSRLAGAYLDMGLIDECTYSSAVISMAYPNNGYQTGWKVPEANDDSDYAVAFDEAAQDLSAALSMNLANKCQVANNKRCCVHGAFDSCRQDPTKNCKMDASNQWCVVGSHGC